MIKNPYIYIAAPFFNDTQLRRVENVKSLLSIFDLEYFSPKDESMFVQGVTTPEEIFNVNINALKKADVLICITDDKDTGTIFEAGWCSASNIPIIYLWTTAKEGQKFNIMLAASGSVCKTYSQLEDALVDLIATKQVVKKDWSNEGTIYE
jgi:nucleoside 2-deoxyribosyltransferase